MKKSFCIIPVRGGSKGIPRKNLLKIYANLSLLEWTIFQAKKVYDTENIIISTEDFELKNIAKSCDVRVIDRPEYLAKDESSTLNVVDHLFEIFELDNLIVDSFTILQVTSPLREIINIKDALKLINSNQYDSVISVYEDHNHPAKNYLLNEKYLKPVLPKHEFSSRQNLPKVLRRNGAIFSVKTNFYKEKKQLWGGRMGYVLMSKERSIDIDYFEDYLKAKEFLKNIKK